ncbi:hypothetical protein [Clostridium cochlearium]|jgi:hypothetical protein|uniref:hypothetical protein n=1 Tax=Clostridium cochlearium TaxID=1494 RepID=UPI00241DC05C|nr:hypothetical protein [Clostridium cochlearium]MBE6065013.1 hypothetical protein [Clostridium cochlearium]
MNNKHLKQEISRLLTTVKQTFGKDSREYKNLEYLLDILESTYRYNYDGERDLLDELNKLLIKLSHTVPELATEKFSYTYPNISNMLKYLDEWLSE